MHHARSTRLAVLMGLIAAIGCGSGRPQEASAKAPEEQKAAAGDRAGAIPAGEGVPMAAGPSASATVTGTVKLSGAAPAPERVKMDADPQCQLQHKEPVTKQEVVVNADGTLRHVFVYVKAGLEGQAFTPPAEPVTLDQHGCMYTPHVVGIQVNQPFQIVNSDATLHNVNCKPAKSKPFNLAQPVQGMKSTKQFTAPEIMVKCACNVHPWMAAYVGVVEHPYYGATGEDGAFSLAHLPAGTYTIEAWHETYGTQTQTVSVGDGEAKEVNFEFKAQ